MRRPSVLIITYHYLPAETPGSRRLSSVARLLTQRGWDVSILTATGSRAGVVDLPGIDVIRTTQSSLGADGRGQPAIASPAVSRIPLLRNVTRFPDKYAWWNLALTPRIMALVRERKIDVVLSSSPPHSLHLGVLAARRRLAFRWVAEFRDPWMFPSRRAPSWLSAALQRRLERDVVTSADGVVANTQGNRDALLEGNPGLDPARVRVSTNGYDASLFGDSSFPDRPAETADITYVGEVYAGMLERYCAAVAAIRARDERHVPKLAVYGMIEDGERRRIAGMGLSAYVEDRGFVSHEASINAMKNARSLLVLLPDEERWKSCVPSKLYWYLAARRPILALVPEGDTSQVVRELGAGEVLSGPVSDISQRLEAFVERARTTPIPSRNGDTAARYSMDTIVDGLERVLREVSDGNPA